MAKKIRLTRPELKRQRDMLTRYERYLPMLKLKQQQLQITVREAAHRIRVAEQTLADARTRFARYEAVLAYRAGLDVRRLAAPESVATETQNVAGINVPVFKSVAFPAVDYSLFSTPAWVDRALADLRALNRAQAEVDVLRQQHEVLHRELTKIIQRVNLFEKIKIPEAVEAIRVIRIHLGDEMTAAVGRAKIAKAKLSSSSGRTGAPAQGAAGDEAGPA
ncbi:MAG TPA: V-type ATP synthase subunit D [Thermoanaerobaculales bacterium]|nr:V-type ATP synthase subunit D [Thermoanaerobaculales bacterium]HQL29315.1 V-type ATP synthase subunit D [Thermoanaerobaculales bacterium]HQN96329.1 V-type ATP synthase subunit D [Thermoanaerobaculales bacterium]HQP44445.1 V-type ATP synthase subunit D [Thermoanaerobaculales bacterium]